MTVSSVTNKLRDYINLFKLLLVMVVDRQFPNLEMFSVESFNFI